MKQLRIAHAIPAISILTLALLTVLPNDTFAQTIDQDFQVQSDGETLAATLYCPSDDGPFPCVIFTHGSEPGVRENYRSFIKPFVERGYAVAVFDKRGCGESTGTYVEAPDLNVPAADLIACVDAVAKNKIVDPDKIGVWGVSQGGWVGPLAASKSEQIAFVIMISGPAISPLEQNLFDKGNQLQRDGFSPQEIAKVTEVRRLVWTYLTYGTGEQEALKAWDAAQSEDWFRAFENQIPMGDRDTLLKHPRLIHFAAHSSYDPKPALRSLKVPVLAVYGDADTIVPVQRCAELMESFFEGERKSLLTVKRFADADHGIRVRTASGSIALADGYWDTVLDWTDRTVASLDVADKDDVEGFLDEVVAGSSTEFMEIRHLRTSLGEHGGDERRGRH